MKLNIHINISNYFFLFLTFFFALNCLAQNQVQKTVDCSDNDYNCLIKKYSQQIEDSPEDAEPYFYTGLIYEKRANYKKAIEYYDKVIELNPNFSAVYYQRARSYDSLKQSDLALKDLRKFVELCPQEEENIQEAFAKTYKKLRDIEKFDESQKKGIVALSKKIEENPEDSINYYNRAGIFNTIGEYQKSLEDHNKAIELKPDRGSYYYSRARNYYSMGFYYEAINDYGKAIELNPNDSESYFGRSKAYFRIGEREKAEADQKKYDDLAEKP